MSKLSRSSRSSGAFFQIVREKKKRKKSDPRQLRTTWVLLKTQEAEVHFLSWFLLLYTVLLLLEGRRDKCEDIAAKFHMLGKMGEVAEVAAAGVFLCSRDAGFITGKKETKHYFSLQQSINWRQLRNLRKLPKKISFRSFLAWKFKWIDFLLQSCIVWRNRVKVI